MGIIAGLLISAGMLGVDSAIPMWVRIACNTALALGVMCGGWRIVKTMGSKVTKLKPVDGFCAESAAAISINIASALGVPVSTTHTITGSIMGVGSLRRFTAVRWGVAGKIVWAWIITIPCAAAISALTYAITIRF
jgi:PiT family inorganic phosphate transporter